MTSWGQNSSSSADAKQQRDRSGTGAFVGAQALAGAVRKYHDGQAIEQVENRLQVRSEKPYSGIQWNRWEDRHRSQPTIWPGSPVLTQGGCYSAYLAHQSRKPKNKFKRMRPLP